jgi:hypothetical protein
VNETTVSDALVDHLFDADACVEQLLQRHLPALRERASAGGAGLFVLIDPMAGDPVLSDPLPAGLDTTALNAARSQAWNTPCHSLSLPPRLDLDLAMAPYLVELSGADDPWLHSTLEWALRETVRSWQAPADAQPAHRVGGWLHSAAFGDTLAQHLSNWLVLSTRANTSARYLRLADRRVWGLTAHVLGEGAVAQCMAPVHCWQWIDGQAACSEILATTNDEQAPSPGPLATFSAAQWALMALGEKVHGHMAHSTGQRLGTPGDNPTQWQPVSAAQWQAALRQVSPNASATHNKQAPQEGTPA